jgi:hypothetical protein
VKYKVIELEVAPDRGAAALVAGLSMPGYVFCKMERKDTKVRVYFRKEARKEPKGKSRSPGGSRPKRRTSARTPLPQKIDKAMEIVGGLGSTRNLSLVEMESIQRVCRALRETQDRLALYEQCWECAGALLGRAWNEPSHCDPGCHAFDESENEPTEYMRNLRE